MSAEHLPEPSLALFPDKTVQYQRRIDSDLNDGYESELVIVPVDKIDSLEDHRLRSALWQQFRSDENKASTALFVFADSQNRHTRSVGIYRKPLNVRFSDQRVEDVNLSFEVEVKHDHAAESRTAGFIAKLLRRKQ